MVNAATISNLTPAHFLTPNARHHPPRRDVELKLVSRMKAALFAVGRMPLLARP